LIEELLFPIYLLFVFLLEFGIIYKLYQILYNKFFEEKPDGDQLEIRINIFRCSYLIIALYLFEITGYPISRVLIDTGILWVVGMITILFIINRIATALEKR